MKQSFYYQNNRLFCDNLDLKAFTEKHNTPFYLYSRTEIERNCRQVKEAGAGLDFLPCYALKANYNPAILQIILEQGFGADVVSGGELLFALKAGFPPEKIVFAGVGKTAGEIELALENNIHSLNIESSEELKVTSRIAAGLGKKARIAFRINPDIDAKTHAYISTGLHSNKFGISAETAFELYEYAAKDNHLHPVGIHVHIGSQITRVGPYLETVDFLTEFVKTLNARGIPVEYLDLGGGIGIEYHQNFTDTHAASTFIQPILPEYLNGLASLGLKLVIELGRSVVGSAGLLVSEVLYRKKTPAKQFIIVDAAMNNLIRPSLYNAYHEIIPMVMNGRTMEVVDVVGPVCETGDFLAKERQLQRLEPGDHIAVSGAGAYGQALSSNYNLRPTVAEYLIHGEDAQCIYRGQTIEDIMNQYIWDQQ